MPRRSPAAEAWHLIQEYGSYSIEVARDRLYKATLSKELAFWEAVLDTLEESYRRS